MRHLLIALFLIFSHVLFAQRVQDIFRSLNSPYDEQNPVISPDGQTLFLTIGNHPSNTGGKKDPGDIWISQREGSKWSAPVHGGSLLNDRAYNAVAGFSPDGAQLFLHGHYGSSAAPAKTQGISVSRIDASGWSRPSNISIPYFLNKSSILSGSVSADNSVFVFSAESYGTHGVEDIYITVRQNDKWGEPRNLGSAINTQFQELSPTLSGDNKTLYFSSNGIKGSGSFDIFSATRLDDSWTNWSAPENLGTQINSEGRELSYHPYEVMGFALYTTTKSSDGYGDVRVFVPNILLPVKDTVVYASLDQPKREDDTSKASPILENALASADTTAQVETAAPELKVVKVFGKIINAKTGETVRSKISFAGAGMEEQFVQSDAGGYAIGVPLSEYAIRIEANGYISSLEHLDIKAFGMRDLEMNFKLQPVELGTTVNLKNVLFVQAKTDILPESFPELDLVISFLKENPKVKIELMGHTDGRGVHADNVRLSQQRVDKVKEYLVSKGIESRRISGKGFGGSKPIASNDTEESRRMNRRVEFVIRKF
ncbi:MAG: OmpA family protein [Cyclobacteriaceae bacterium]